MFLVGSMVKGMGPRMQMSQNVINDAERERYNWIQDVKHVERLNS